MGSIRLTTFVHPGHAYRLEYPGHWECVQQDEARSCGFGPRDRDNVGLWITIMPFSVDTQRIEDHLPALFEQAMGGYDGANVRRDPALRHFVLKADSTAQGDAGHFWMIAGGDLVLFASSQTPAGERDIWNPQFERVVGSLEITRDRDLARLEAANEVYRRLCALHPDQDYRLDEGGIRGRNHRISLANLYRQVAAASPERRDELVERFVAGLAFVAEHRPGEELLDSVRGRILPVLKPDSYFKVGTATERLVRSGWVGDVAICYAIQEESVSRLITDWDLGRWGLEREALSELAIENLTELSWPERLEGAREAGGRVMIVATDDGFDASRLLHPDLHRILSGPLGSPFYAGIPTNQTLVAFSAGNHSLFEHVLRQLRREWERSAHAITPEPFLVTANGVARAQM